MENIEKGHLRHIQDWYPNVLQDRILDIGSGRGKFLVEVAQAGGDAVGIERSETFIATAHQRAKDAGVAIRVERGMGEQLPFPDQSFGFVNMSELIEHVEDPVRVLREVRRVLKDEGMVYISVPNRYALWDPHFHVYFVNWLPRSLSSAFLRLFGIHKDLSTELDNGLQRLDEMHYYTLAGITKLCRALGLQATDNREQKIKNMRISAMRKIAFLAVYRAARLFYLDTFHLRLIKILH